MSRLRSQSESRGLIESIKEACAAYADREDEGAIALYKDADLGVQIEFGKTILRLYKNATTELKSEFFNILQSSLSEENFISVVGTLTIKFYNVSGDYRSCFFPEVFVQSLSEHELLPNVLSEHPELVNQILSAYHVYFTADEFELASAESLNDMPQGVNELFDPLYALDAISEAQKQELHAIQKAALAQISAIAQIDDEYVHVAGHQDAAEQ